MCGSGFLCVNGSALQVDSRQVERERERREGDTGMHACVQVCVCV